ncbi:hypothetical protein OBBRIDRAFT_826431 [Obba rivulosa]|uniref:Uncharacterized protein n=1 Tax=Obba rivulosa TaxID=1052685 RepID=A0A8E2DL97_9APHY|nr:hypothetical protein OBBRIDRAFT_826431 [Obba rivulosa]
MPLPIIQARIFTFMFSSFFLGVHLTTTTICLWALLVRNPSRGRKIHYGFLAVTLVMACIGSLDVSVDAVTNVRVWTTGDIKLFTDETQWMNLTKNIDISLQLLIGDAVLTYRCWIVYERKWLAIIPSLTIWLGSVSVAILLMVRSVTAIGSSGINAPSLVSVTAAQQALTVGLNTLTSSLIILRIWKVSSSIRMYMVGQDRLLYAIRVIAESGSMYAMSAAICLATILARSTAVYITADCLVQITGICFNLIIIRFDHNLASRSQVDTELNSRAIPLSSLSPSARGMSNTARSARCMEIAVSQDTEVDNGSFTAEMKAGELKLQPLGA